MSPAGGRWVAAGDLRLGDQLKLRRWGNAATVTGLLLRAEQCEVYNLRVVRLHNYAVGETELLVHNKCKHPGWRKAKRDYWKENSPTVKTPKRRVLVRDKKTGEEYEKIESKELHHKEPYRDGGSNEPSNLQEVWPTEHAATDAHRHTGDGVIEVLGPGP